MLATRYLQNFREDTAMRTTIKPIALLTVFGVLIAACGLAPAPPPTAPPTATFTPEPTATVTPTLGPREYIEDVYCWLSPVDDGEFNMLRFFGNGTVLDATVQPFSDCQDAWSTIQQHMVLENEQSYGHGQYYLSDDLIQFELAAPHSTTIVGEVKGILEGNRMILSKGGATQEYIRVVP